MTQLPALAASKIDAANRALQLVRVDAGTHGTKERQAVALDQAARDLSIAAWLIEYHAEESRSE